MPAAYRHTQIGYVTIVALGVGLVIFGYVSAAASARVTLPGLILLALALILFATLTTTVDGGVLEVRFGPGLVRRRIHLSDVQEIRVVRNPWYCGWGIRWIGRGWMWNVSGLQAVDLKLRDGRRLRIGTDEPQLLAQALRAASGAV